MFYKFLSMILILILVSGCSSSIKEEKASLEAGPPTRPLLYEYEGLKWGMTKEEVKSVWGAGVEKNIVTLSYTDKGEYKKVEALFKSVPASSNIQTVAGRPAGDDQPVQFLFAVYLSVRSRTDPTESKPKDTVRPGLISNYGEPLSDSKLRAKLYCERADCEIFRVAECTLLEVHWNPAVPELNLPERVDSLTYMLAPDTLITAIPFDKWAMLRGSILPSVPPEFKAKVKGFTQGTEGTSVADVVKLIGPANLYLEEIPGKGELYYFWLTGSFYSLEIDKGRLLSVSYTLYGEDRN